MTTFAIEKRHQQQYIFVAPQWTDTLAKFWLILVAILLWLDRMQPKADVYLLSRFDLARKHIGPIPPDHWRVGYAFAGLMFVFLWQEILIISSVKVWGSLCLA